MSKRIPAAAILVLIASVSFARQAAAPVSSHKMLAAADVAWGPPPPALPPGAQVAVISGDPGAAAPFTIRVKMPPGYRIASHWHPTDEHVTVLSGSFAIGMGDRYDQAALKTLAPGGFVLMPATMRHFAATADGCVIQIHGVGPFTLTYVNPADDPRQQAAKP